MSTESLQLAIEEAQAQLDGRESKRMIAWIIITSLLFFVPVVLFFQLSSDSVIGNSYAPMLIVWLMVSMGLGNAAAAALLAGRTVELRLAIASATTLLEMAKERDDV